MSRYERLTDEQWTILSPLIPPSPVRADGRGRPEVHDDRAVMDGVLWVLRAGASWADLSDRFPSPSTCFRRFSRWVKAGVLRKILEELARDLEERGGIDLTECFIDGTFAVAKIVGDRAYDSDPLDQQLAAQGIELIGFAPKEPCPPGNSGWSSPTQALPASMENRTFICVDEQV